MTGGINCLNRHGEMALKRIEKETTFKGEKIKYQFETYVCEECNISIGTVKQAAKTQNAIADAYRAKIGLLTGEEIKKKRAERNWSQKELAKEAGVGIASRYTGNRASISIPRIKLVLNALEREVGATPLEPGDKLLFAAKYLWYTDMLAFKELGRSITGSTYAALPYGPQLNNYNDLVELIQNAD